ncbi:VOC family protein [uncultured Odoribacter sp.]|uniref:VOC family protein n=1 Tax=uncultured Odoribacter sp. TaxID=876416 RepID=UPI002603A679|nr:VOC family protein [uncultured Odoribacter sp.]
MKNRIEFVEIPAADFRRAVKFYETVFGVQLTVCDSCEYEKMAFFPQAADGPNLAISWAADFRPSRDGILIHLNVEDIGITLECIRQNGGRIVRPKTKIEVEERGYFALFSDSEGNTLGLYGER